MLEDVTTVIEAALRLCGQSGAPGRGIGTEEYQEGLRFLNRMLNGWSALSGYIFGTFIYRATITAAQASYTIGPGGFFDTPRPIRIESANLWLTSQQPEVRVPLVVLNDDEWSDVSVTNIRTQVPVALYYNKGAMGSELGTIYLWGIETQANDLELFVWSPLDSGLTLAGSVIVPEGYLDAIVYSLAERMMPLYWKKSTPEKMEVKEQARKARAAIISQNCQAPKQASDAPTGNRGNGARGPYYNYLTGLTR